MGLNIILKQFLHGSVYNAHGELKWTVTDNGFRFEMNGKEYKPEYNKVMEVDKTELRLSSSDAISTFNAAIFKLIAVYCYKIANSQQLNALSGWDFLEQTDMLNALSGHISFDPDVSWQCYEDGIRIIAGKEHILKYTELYLYKEDYWHDIYPKVPFSLCQMLICFAVMIKSLVAKKPAVVPEKKPEPAVDIDATAPIPEIPQQAAPASLEPKPLQAQGGGVPLQRTAVQQPQAGGGVPLQRTAPQQAVQQPQAGGGVPLQRTAPQQAVQQPQAGGGVPLQRTAPQQAVQQPQAGGGVPLERTVPQQAVQQPQAGGGVPLERTVPQQVAPVQQIQTGGAGVPLEKTAPQQQSVAVPKAPQQMPPKSIAPVTAPKNAVPQQAMQPSSSPKQQAVVPTAENASGADADLAQLSPLELQALQDYFDEMCLEFKNIEKSVRKYYPAWALEDIKTLTGTEFIKAFIKKIS